MNKKGFMFVETIVMCAALMLGLLIIYNSYTSSISREKERLNYNTIEGQYKLIAVKQYLQGKNVEWQCTESGGSFNCTKAQNLLSSANFLEISGELTTTLMELYGIESIYLAKCEDSSGEIIDTEIVANNDDFKQYLKTIKSCDDENKDGNPDYNYRFIAEFYDDENEVYSYAWVGYPIINEEEGA